MPDNTDWLIVGDFNLIRKPENRNRPGGDLTEIGLFNEAISSLDLTGITLHGKQFTWSNKQPSPLLERLDWIFTSSNWTNSYPVTYATTMSMEPSYHSPCIISIQTAIPKRTLFRFENYWLEHPNFLQLVQDNWSQQNNLTDRAKVINAKFKNLRRVFKARKLNLGVLNLEIDRLKLVINFFEAIEEFRDLNLMEWNFRSLVREKLTLKLNLQRAYWRQRGTIKWVKLGDASTKLFHANATIRLRKNLIPQLVLDQGIVVTTHAKKETTLWNSYKERIGKSEYKAEIFNIENFIHPSIDLSILDEAFSLEEINEVVKLLPMDKSIGPDGFNNEFIKKCCH